MKYRLFILFLFLFANCVNENRANKDSSFERNIVQTLKELSPDTDFSTQKIVLIIPFDGCSSCFQKAVSLISKVKENEGLVVMPCLQKRRVYNFIEENAIELNNVIVDTLQQTVKRNIVDINPKIYVICESKILFSMLVDELDIKTFQSKYFR